MKNILLPTDFSDNAWSAAVYALKLYKDEVCTFYFLNSSTIKVSTASNISSKLHTTVRDIAMSELLELKEQAELANNNINHSFEVILSSHSLNVAIETAIIKHQINLVVMGTKGATGAKEFFFGSNVVKVIKNMRLCPILVVPDEFDFVQPTQIAFSTDYNRFYDEMELKPLRELASLFNSKIRVLHINVEKTLSDIQDYNYNKLKEYLKDFDHSFHFMPSYGKMTEEINDFIEDLEINMLSLVNYQHSFIESIVNEPVIKKIGFKPLVPFLVIPE